MRNYTVTTIWDIPIRINISLVVFLPILAWLIGSGGQMAVYASLIELLTGVSFDMAVLRAGYTPWIIGIIAALGLFLSVTLHELGHSWVALRYGLTIESITLWILGGIAALTSVPREWNREFWIAIAGPLTSIGLGIGFWVVLLVLPASLQVLGFVVGWLAVINLTLAAFNLLPAFPMDGGRILRALLARRRTYGSATRIAGRIGIIFALLFAVVGVLNFNVILILLAVFIYGAATTESRTILVDELLEGLTVGDIMTPEPHAVSAEINIATFTDQMLQDRQTMYPVLDEDGEVAGVVGLEDLKSVKPKDHGLVTVGDIMRPVPQIDSSADAFDTLATLNQARANAALVVDGGHIVGLLSESDYAHALNMQGGFQ